VEQWFSEIERKGKENTITQLLPHYSSIPTVRSNGENP
jgi:hypothetical protein